MADILLKDKNGADVICENVKSVNFRTVDGGSVSFGEKQEFNIAYGDEPPEDTSKLWIKCNVPEDVRVIPPSQIGKDDLSALYSDGEITTLEEKLPKSIYKMASSTIVDNQIYLFGGYASADYLNQIICFDVNKKSVTTLGTLLPKRADDIASATVGKKVYLFGGYSWVTSSDYRNNVLNTINVFDIDTQTISTLDTTFSGFQATTVTVENKIYLIGCRNFTGKYQSSVYGGTAIQVFDVDTEILSTLTAKLTTGASGTSVETVNNKIYIFGGYGKDSNYYNTISVLDIDTNAMTVLSTTLPTAVYGGSSALIDNRIYLFGGIQNNKSSPDNYLDTIYMFDTNTDTVTTLGTKLPKATAWSSFCIFGTKVYLFGGANDAGTDINVFETATRFHLDENKALVVTSPTTNLFNLLPNVIVGADLAYIGNANNEAEKVEAYIYKDDEWTLI